VLIGLPVESGDKAPPDKIDVSDYPAEQQLRYEYFRVKCSKCHTLARPINARLKPEAWKNYVKKMARRPGSGINDEVGKEIVEFLKYYSSRVEAAEAKESAADSADAGTK
jgi:hypothetical protein